MLLRLATVISCLAAATSVAAEPTELTSQAIRATFSGSLINLDTPAGTIIPVRFGKDGLVSGEAGVLASVLGAARDRGRLWAANDKLCVKWFRWFEAETRCVSVRQDGTRIYWHGPKDRSGTGTIAEPAPVVAAPLPAPAVTAQPAQPADTTPRIEIANAQDAESAGKLGEAPTIRFAAAGLGAMSLLPPLASEPSHVLDGSVRSVVEAAPAAEASEDKSSPQQTTTTPEAPEVQDSAAQPSSEPARKAPAIATAYASSSTVVLASFRVAGVAQNDMLNVRSGPSEDYAPVGGLPPEVRGVKIVGPCQQDWCPIRHGRVTGWVNRYFLAEETSGPAPAATR
jgi:hypothetical protein